MQFRQKICALELAVCAATVVRAAGLVGFMDRAD
jgi:hypothetical protein